MIIEQWVRFEHRKLCQLVLLIETSDKIKDELFDDVCKRLINLMSRVPDSIIIKVGALGSKNLIDFYIFKKNIRTFFNENINRLTVIAPCLGALEKNKIETVLCVISLSKIFDLDDYKDNPIIKKSIYLNLDENGDISGRKFKEIYFFSNEAEKLFENILIGHEISTIEIGSYMHFPFYWSNEEYSFKDFKLVWSEGKKCDIIAGFFGPENAKIKGTIKYKNGEYKDIKLNNISENEYKDIWYKMKGDEKNTILKILKAENINCPICKKGHYFDGIRCYEDDESLTGRGVIIFNSIKDKINEYKEKMRKEPSFIIFRKKNKDIEFSLNGYFAIKGNKNEILVNNKRNLLVYWYNEKEKKWEILKENNSKYHIIENDESKYIFPI